MNWLWKRLTLSVLMVFAFLPAETGLPAEQELKFPMLQIGTEVLTNAVVTTRNKDYVFILHSRGMANYKVAKLSDDVLAKLGISAMLKPKPQTNAVTAWARGTMASLQTGRVKALQQSVVSRLPIHAGVPEVSSAVLWGTAAALVFVYFFFCYCSMLICQKAGTEPGALVWLPVLQLVPLVRAAGMPPVWVLAFIIPGVNLLAQVIWSFRIAQARRKGVGIAILLLLPVTNLLAFLYLAFSETARKVDPDSRAREIMTLEAA
jgi:hypothetical protein